MTPLDPGEVWSFHPAQDLIPLSCYRVVVLKLLISWPLTTLKNYWGLCISFLISAVTSCHKFSSIKQWNFITLQFWRSEIQNHSTGLKVKMSTMLIPSGGAEERICFLVSCSFSKPLTFLDSWSLPHMANLCVCHHLLLPPLSISFL